MDAITAIGIMSGTSVDGLDILAAEFKWGRNRWNYRILNSQSIDYPDSLRSKLIGSIRLSGEELIVLDHQLGEFIGENVLEFCRREKIEPQLIASHGHTVFHQPEKRITLQIGDGQTIFQKTGIKVINDFRKIDVLRCGQGAPLVPVGDKLLFGEFQFCLNIGGFSNISFNSVGVDRVAYDICPANIVLNYLARQRGMEFDDQGVIARKGDLITEWLDELNALDYYTWEPPKSLGLEWVKKNIFNMSSFQNYPIESLMKTYVEHIAFQIDASIKREMKRNPGLRPGRVLVTGGGAYHSFLIERMKSLSEGFEYVVPEKEIIEFKEALIFAFMGVLRDRNEINIWKSVTGAIQDSSGGTVHYYP